MKFTTVATFALAQCATGVLSFPTLNVRALEPLEDDYPYGETDCGVPDEWNFYTCQGTSFVAYRINERLDIDFNNQYEGEYWGNANTWDNAAEEIGLEVNQTPQVGAVAQTSEGRFGHVAWVAAYNGTDVTVEEYNFSEKEAYNTRTVSKDAFEKYIHF